MNKVVLDVARVTAAELDWWLELIPTLDWVFAVTYADGAPHEYVVGDRTPGLTAADCVRAARVIRTFGTPAKFFKATRTYLVDAAGWKYWDMAGADVATAGLINRARVEHVYGVQNAPSTRSAASTLYDEVATEWDRMLGATEVEREGIAAIARTFGPKKLRVLDIGCGTGLALDLGITESVRLVGVDPSQAMLNELVRKYPLMAGIHPMTFGEAIEQRVLGGSRFDVVIALGGAASYLTDADYSALPTCGEGRMILTAYAEGEAPVTGDASEDQLGAARDRLRSFTVRSGGTLSLIGRFEVAVIGG